LSQPAAIGPAVHEFLTEEASGRPGDDPIFALDAEANRRARAGESILNATLGALMEDDGRLAILPGVVETLAAVPAEQAAAYAPISGDAGFLQAVIADLYGQGPLAAQSVAAATPGGTGALHHAIVNTLDPGQALLTSHFFWGPYRSLAVHTRRRVETFPMFGTDGGFAVDALEEALARLMSRQGRALVVLNSPCHNPTGYSLDGREWRATTEVLRRAARHGPVTLCVDLAYARFAAGDRNAWVAEVQPALGEVLLLAAWTASKSFAQYGARVGALVATHPDPAQRNRIAAALAFSCRGTWSNCNHAGLLAVQRLLSEPALAARVDGERERLRRLLAARVDAFNSAARAAGLSYPRYEGGFFVTVFCADADAAARRMRELGVYIVPIPGGLRVALCSTPVADVPRLVAALRDACAAVASS